MTVVLDLEPELEEALKREAASKGSAVTSYLKTLIQMHVNLGPTYEEVMAPVWQNFADSGMTDEELNNLIDRERPALWDGKQASGA